ncbi:hypothetical protein [Deinococcus gobiensis]|uniref:Uncharacterized protein n=1 Tax=Deinococcus gobiensis (strain DSM 21396 / JCM 16679 / CGMCC 1.7299 / I-0) TaxID=745776 RepID=H8H2X2_DEIGI|nr:hypothetical protein [Deinococcus gobiensis]AFD27869.1 hypothetical protein DGo_PC0077 [Deinococcus gobiensis I-0]
MTPSELWGMSEDDLKTPALHPQHWNAFPVRETQELHAANLYATTRALSPRLLFHFQRRFAEIVPGYSLSLHDLWMIGRDPGPFRLLTYRSNGETAPVIVTKQGEHLSFQWTESLLHRTKKLHTLTSIVSQAMCGCLDGDQRRWAILRFPHDTPEDLQQVLRRQLPQELRDNTRCAALLDEGRPLVMTTVALGHEYWIALVSVEHMLHAWLAESSQALTRHTQHLQGLGLWPVEAATPDPLT